MKLKLLDDSYLNVLIILIIALQPFFTIGFLGMGTLICVTSVIGSIFLISSVVRMVYCIKKKRVNIALPAIRIMATYYSVPYFFVLSYFILRIKDINSTFIFWFSVVSFILVTPIVIKEFFLSSR